jgi:AcrR family transcriptional regulator
MTVRRPCDRLELRKQPVQDRSQARLDRLIAVAEEMIVEVGLLGLSIREVARRADTNIATFYQFFPSRGSLTRHIVEIYNAKLEQRLAEVASAVSENTGLRSTLESLQAAMVDFYASNPVTREIWPSIQADHALRELDREDSERNAARLVQLIRRLRPDAALESVESAADLMVVTGGPIFRHAVTQPPDRRRRLLSQHLKMTAALIEAL